MENHSLPTKITHVHSGLRRTINAVLLLFSTTGCSLGAQNAPAAGPIVVLSRPDNAAALGSMRLVARDSSSYQRVWALAWNRNVTPPAAPQVDFSRYDVLVIATGPQGITGGRIEITKLEDDGSARVFHVLHTMPGRGCLGGTAMTYNALFARVPKGSGVPLFHDSLSKPPCKDSF